MAFIGVRVAWALIGLAGAMPCLATSSASSAASESVGASVGSASDSVKHSSNSSSADKRVAEGDYKLIELAAVPERPGTMRMKLLALAGDDDGTAFYLYLPQQTVALHRLAPGHIVTARQRAYGLEFSTAQQAFFLVLEDAWYRELQSVAVVL